MTDRESEEGESASRRLIREAKEEAWHARRQLHRDLPDPSPQAKWELATALADYRDLLLDYRGEDALDTPWEERDVNVDVIEQLLTETTTTSESLPRRGAASQQRTVTLVHDVDGMFLIRLGKELDAIYSELGFGAAPAESTHRTEIDDELIEEVEEWRQRNLEA